MKTRANLIELFNRAVSVVSDFSGKRDYYINGDNNLYPNEIDRVINSSPTGKSSAATFQKFISGKGVKNDFLINRKNKKYVSDLVRDISRDISRQNGSFIWVGYGLDENTGNIVPKNYKVLDYLKCRLEEVDDDGRNAKIIYKDWEKSGYFNKEKDKRYYPYKPNLEVVLSQMEKDTPTGDIEEKINGYRGQVFYLNLTPQYTYALSNFDPVFNDMDSEFRFSLYTNTQMRTGWVGKTIILTQGLDEEKEEQIQKDLSGLLGAENSGNAYHLNVAEAENLDNVLKIKQVKAQFDDKLSINTDKRIRRNITSCANNLPEALIYAGDGALFGAGGDAILEHKKFYNEQTLGERLALNRALKNLKIESEIIPLV